MVKLSEINQSILEDSKGKFIRLRVHKPDALRFRILTKKYKFKRWIMFGTLLDFFERYYDVLESKYFRLQSFLDEKKKLEEENARLKEALLKSIDDQLKSNDRTE
jgi:cell shape-determining protein MreC